MENKKVKGWTIECSTGCSCCSYENHTRGPYQSLEDAQRDVEEFKRMKLLSSQFSKTGKYHVSEVDVEILPDGRLILDRYTVVDSWGSDRID